MQNIIGTIEKNKILYHDTNNVLVYAKSLRELKAAYPNYFGDIGKFLEKLLGYINEYKEEKQT